jgi:hypothetical protein
MTIPFAIVAGIFLWLSSLATGWTANYLALHRMATAISNSLRVRENLGPQRASRLADCVRHHAPGSVGYIVLGFLLAPSPSFSSSSESRSKSVTSPWQPAAWAMPWTLLCSMDNCTGGDAACVLGDCVGRRVEYRHLLRVELSPGRACAQYRRSGIAALFAPGTPRIAGAPLFLPAFGRGTNRVNGRSATPDRAIYRLWLNR